MSAPVFLHHESSLRHDPGPHPERAERIVAIDRELEARGGLGWERRESSEAERDALLAVHPLEHIRFIRELSEMGGGAIDLDTAVSERSYEAALHGAGGFWTPSTRCSRAPAVRSARTGRRAITPSRRGRW